MLLTLIPLFDEKLAVKAYSVFAQKDNMFLNPLAQGIGVNDGATHIPGLDMINAMGIETLSDEKEVFVPVSNVSIFTDMRDACSAPAERIVFLIDSTIPPVDMYVNRLVELKKQGYKLAIRKLSISEFQAYAPILQLVDYVFLNNKKIVIDKARIFFSKLYPQAKLVAGNIDTQEEFEELRQNGGYQLYEGEFYRIPVTQGTHEIAPLKVTYLELLKLVNHPDFELTQVADIIGRDTALTISLLKMVNTVVKTAEITTIRHAAAMLGQREMKKWINTAVANEIYSDSPGELTRLSLLRARFAENLAGVFNLKLQSEELFLMGLFSIIDVILEKPMSEALDSIQVSKNIRAALVKSEGPLAPVYEFIKQYENADWAAVSRTMLLSDISMNTISDAYTDSLVWYRNTLGIRK